MRTVWSSCSPTYYNLFSLMCYPHAVQVHPSANTEAGHTPTHISYKVLGTLMTIFTKIVQVFLTQFMSLCHSDVT